MMQEKKFDVVIIGAGFAGNCQARHLLLNIPNIRIALIDRRSIERTEKDLKVGESTVEISAMFLYKELGLHEYLIENHVPKHGLNFHWPKDQNCTEKIIIMFGQIDLQLYQGFNLTERNWNLIS
jgi:2-polyprenyl-6-methoxyphenol hydroxylase-like FAD-dependent oxidoreductase